MVLMNFWSSWQAMKTRSVSTLVPALVPVTPTLYNISVLYLYISLDRISIGNSPVEPIDMHACTTVKAAVSAYTLQKLNCTHVMSCSRSVP